MHEPHDLRATPAPPADFPPWRRQAWNLARALADVLADGCQTLTEEQYRQRPMSGQLTLRQPPHSIDDRADRATVRGKGL